MCVLGGGGRVYAGFCDAQVHVSRACTVCVCVCVCVCARALVRVPVRATNSQTENTMYMQIIIYVGGKKHVRSGGGSHERYKE